jgi:hypothetical protein
VLWFSVSYVTVCPLFHWTTQLHNALHSDIQHGAVDCKLHVEQLSRRYSTTVIRQNWSEQAQDKQLLRATFLKLCVTQTPQELGGDVIQQITSVVSTTVCFR